MLCAVALSVAFPLRNYLEQRTELAAAVAAQQDLEQQRDELQARKARCPTPTTSPPRPAAGCST